MRATVPLDSRGRSDVMWGRLGSKIVQGSPEWENVCRYDSFYTKTDIRRSEVSDPSVHQNTHQITNNNTLIRRLWMQTETTEPSIPPTDLYTCILHIALGPLSHLQWSPFNIKVNVCETLDHRKRSGARPWRDGKTTQLNRQQWSDLITGL